MKIIWFIYATGIQPKNNVWNNDDCAYFQQMTVQKQFATEIKAIRKGVDSPGYVLEMILIDVSTPKDININADLVANQHANYIWKTKRNLNL